MLWDSNAAAKRIEAICVSANRACWWACFELVGNLWLPRAELGDSWNPFQVSYLHYLAIVWRKIPHWKVNTKQQLGLAYSHQYICITQSAYKDGVVVKNPHQSKNHGKHARALGDLSRAFSTRCIFSVWSNFPSCINVKAISNCGAAGEDSSRKTAHNYSSR